MKNHPFLTTFIGKLEIILYIPKSLCKAQIRRIYFFENSLKRPKGYIFFKTILEKIEQGKQKNMK